MLLTRFHKVVIDVVLSDVKRNGVYHVKQLHTLGDAHRHLENLGFVPGEAITVISRIGGSLIVNVKGSRVALSSELAKNVVV